MPFGINITERNTGVAARFIAPGRGDILGEAVPLPSAINVAATPLNLSPAP
jgi:hypothetical protein